MVAVVLLFATTAALAPSQRRLDVRRQVHQEQQTPENASAADFVAKLNLPELVDEQFSKHIADLQATASTLREEQDAEKTKFLDRLAAEVSAEEEKALATMEAKVGVLIDRVSAKESEVQKAADDVRAAQQAAEDFALTANVFNVLSVAAALALMTAVAYIGRSAPTI